MNQAINTCITGLNNIGQGFWDYAVSIFVQSSVLIILLLIIDFLLRKRVRAVFRYCVWMLVFVKLILPTSFALPTGIGYWLADYWPTETSVSEQKPTPTVEQAVPAAVPTQAEVVTLESAVNETVPAEVKLEPICWQGLVFLGWLAGVLVLSALLIQRVWFVKALVAQSKPAKGRLLDALNECRSQIGIRKTIELRLSDNMASPAVCGLFKPMILMPTTLLEKLSLEKLKAVLIHELAHIKRRDIWVNVVQTVLQIVYFYNPLLWLANAMVRRVREQAVDEMVLVALGAEADSYSNTLIDIGEMAFWRPNLSLRVIGVVESKSALKERIKIMLNRPIPKSAKVGILGLFAIVVIGAVVLPMGCGPARQTALETPIEVGPKELNEAQRVYMEWTEKKFADYLDRSEHTDLSESAKAELEEKWIAILQGPWNKKYYNAINSLAAIKSKKAVKPLLKIAAEHREKDNRDRWMATRALGIIGDDSVVPELIHLVYHYNQNTRFWAQISLVRLTGKNFGTDWQQWGKWWNEEGRKPAFSGEKIKWTTRWVEYADPQKQKESDRKFVERFKDKKTEVRIEVERSLATENNQKAAGQIDFDITPADFDIRLDEKRGLCNLVVSIHNQSNVNIPKLKLRFYRGNPANNLDEAGSAHSGWHEAGPIEPGKSWNERTRDFHLPDGQYEFHVILDYDNAIEESDENNNQTALQVKMSNGQIAEKLAANDTVAQQQSYLVNFEITKQGFLENDWIEITQILGPFYRLQVGQTYTIKGKYRLFSHEQAMLHIYATNGETRSEQGPIVKRGTGEFTRTFTYLKDGWLHLSFYPGDGGSSFGNLYFAEKGSNQQVPDISRITSVVGTTKPARQKAKTARILRIDVDESSEAGVKDISLRIPLAGLKAANAVLPEPAKKQMAAYGITLEDIIKKVEAGLEPIVLLEVKEKTEEGSCYVRISLE